MILQIESAYPVIFTRRRVFISKRGSRPEGPVGPGRER